MTTAEAPANCLKTINPTTFAEYWLWTEAAPRASTPWVSSKKLRPWWIARSTNVFTSSFGTSTGAIIAALIALGSTIDDIHDLYKKHVPTVMSKKNPVERSRALGVLSSEIFATHTFENVKTQVGIVATRWLTERPMIFKGSIDQAHGRKGTFVAGFGVSMADAVEASCSALPFFMKRRQLSLAHTICLQFHFWTIFERIRSGGSKLLLFGKRCGNGFHRKLSLHAATQEMIEDLFVIRKPVFNRGQLI
jgi:hypothetical protein